MCIRDRATSVAYMDFPQTIELKARVQPLDTALFRYPFRVRVQGDKAVAVSYTHLDVYKRQRRLFPSRLDEG